MTPHESRGPIGRRHDHGDLRQKGHHQDRKGANRHGSAVRHALSSIFGGHSHDAADSIDSALEASRAGVRALKISFSILMATALCQVLLVVLTDSTALLADTIHNFGDALTSVPLFLAFMVARRRANDRYTYGYRRAEDLAGIFIVLAIAFSDFIVIRESLLRLFDPRPLSHVGVLAAAGVIGFVGNEVVALYRIRVGRRIGSAALIADGYHSRADGFTSLGVVVAAGGAHFGFAWVDPLAGLAIGIAILGILIGALKQIYYRLMDAVDPRIIDQIRSVAASVEGVKAVGRVQARWLGHRLHASLAVEVDDGIPLMRAHGVTEQVRHALLHDVRHLDSCVVHADPHHASMEGSAHAAVAHHADPFLR